MAHRCAGDADGRELFYIALDDRLMAVPIQFGTSGRAIEPGVPIPLFATQVGGAVYAFQRQQYITSPDGQRFLMNTIIDEAGASPITVGNFPSALKLVSVGGCRNWCDCNDLPAVVALRELIAAFARYEAPSLDCLPGR